MSALQELFAEYDRREAALGAAQKAQAEAMQARSEILELILEAAGPGPFKRNGKQLKIIRRGNTLFFRGSRQEAIEV